jgi:hypothetical protein
MTADFFGATLTTSSNDLEEKIDHGKKEQVKEKSGEEIEKGPGEGQGESQEERKGQVREEGRQESSEEKGGEEGCKEGCDEDGHTCTEEKDHAETETGADDAGASGNVAFAAGG